MRLTLIAAVSALALTGVATASVAAPAAIVQAAEYSDAQLQAFSTAMTQVRAAAPTDGTAPTAEQQAAMAAAVEGSGMDITTFNALATAVSSDEVLRARLAVMDTPESPAGSVAASVTDAEAAQFASAMVQVRAAAPTDGSAPNAEQQTAMASAVSASGLELERFNAIAQAVAGDERLRARLALADARGS
ncbi:MAG: DUF4168 domain-containing protein [Brevundimonas sp.]|uniref:DUF4168 domain-containing protein n=1 Tax=Brevundimonas sp. TaxID=1871086 RepID=UPI00273458A6|nr:DUF4168 domain-containing protein [Brevundimonas sp.]MDP3406046.1 DUF4168 domain-containing protein [Brevundimonas sp.]